MLSIALKTARYKRIQDPVIKIIRSLPVEKRLCNLCDIPETENESPYLYVPYMTILEQRFFNL